MQSLLCLAHLLDSVEAAEFADTYRSHDGLDALSDIDITTISTPNKRSRI